MNTQVQTEFSDALGRFFKCRPLALLFDATFLRHRYFLASLALYILLLLIFHNHEISRYLHNSAGLFSPEERFVIALPAPPPPPLSSKDQPAMEKKPGSVDPAQSVMQATKDLQPQLIKTPQEGFSWPHMKTPQPAPLMCMPDVKFPTDLSKIIARDNIIRLANIQDNQGVWEVVNNPNRTMVRARFTIFQAKYQDGDWNCNPEALKNLILQIRAWSKDRIDANLFPEVLDVGTDQLFTMKPPFIYLTGHKDFHFLEHEVKNLRDYLMLGGALWADNALAGRHSRFDIAFRREMKKVLPDRDFEEVPEDHELFVDSFFQKLGLPSGMNYYREPMEMINIGNKLAVLYTLNGYGHFWEARLNREGKIEWGWINVSTNMGKPRWTHVYGPHMGGHHSGIIYRNINDETTRNVYKLGINVVVHLLVRYQDLFRFLPRNLPASSLHGRPAITPPLASPGNAPPSNAASPRIHGISSTTTTSRFPARAEGLTLSMGVTQP